MVLPEAPVVLVEVLPDPAYAGKLGPLDLPERFQDRADELGTALERQLAEEHPREWALTEVKLELGANLEAESGVVICKTKASGSFQVSLTWTRGHG
jgi:hypothetical protein